MNHVMYADDIYLVAPSPAFTLYVIRKFSKCSVNVKCYLFQTYCSTMYCSALWFNSTKTALTKL